MGFAIEHVWILYVVSTSMCASKTPGGDRYTLQQIAVKTQSVRVKVTRLGMLYCFQMENQNAPLSHSIPMSSCSQLLTGFVLRDGTGAKHVLFWNCAIHLSGRVLYTPVYPFKTWALSMPFKDVFFGLLPLCE